MSVVKITQDNFKTEVLDSDKPVLIDFWAAWCGPCRMVAPVIDQIAEERSDVKVGKVNVDEEGELAMRFSVMSIPTLAVFKGGKLTNKAIGVRPKEEILGLL